MRNPDPGSSQGESAGNRQLSESCGQWKVQIGETRRVRRDLWWNHISGKLHHPAVHDLDIAVSQSADDPVKAHGIMERGFHVGHRRSATKRFKSDGLHASNDVNNARTSARSNVLKRNAARTESTRGAMIPMVATFKRRQYKSKFTYTYHRNHRQMYAAKYMQ